MGRRSFGCSSKERRVLAWLLLSTSYTLLVLIQGHPNLGDSIQSPVAVVEGENAPLTCVVRDLGLSTVVWKKWESGKAGPKILTAGDTRVTSDERVNIIHDKGGDVWVLAIRGAKTSDSGLYICEVNTTPVLRSFHNLTVISLSIQPPNFTISELPSDGADITFEDVYSSYKGSGSILSHNYTSCCVSHNVSKSCLGFCTLQSILDGTPGEPTQCENEFPKIVKCMADGRNHIPCCVREGVPDICQDLCRGEYTTVTDNVKTHFSCPSYIERTLSCIADGVEILPSEPLDIEAIAVSSTSINVTWSVPTQNGDTVTEYRVNVTTLREFDAPFTGLGYGTDNAPVQVQPEEETKHDVMLADSPDPFAVEDSYASYAAKNAPSAKMKNASLDLSNRKEETAEEKVEAKMMQVSIHSDHTFALIKDLKPFTMYEISVIAFNIHGGSLPSFKIRTLTLAPGLIRPKPGEAPKIPDIKTCCVNNGVKSSTCVTKLCDPKMTTKIEIPDLMICAPWTQEVFTCLADGRDHTPCCRERGIPAPCSELCSGNVTRLDYHYFKCLRYMEEYSNCLMEGYGVLPSAPSHVRVSNVKEDFALIHWSAPTTLAETLTGYNVHYRPLSTFEKEYHVIENVHPPFILEHLYTNAEYEVFVVAVNEHGVSQASQRVVFRTADAEYEFAQVEENTRAYNETDCCVKAGMSDLCLPLCSYDATMSDIRALALSCAADFNTLLRCAAGGRDHRQCCSRRGVSDGCLDICSARVPNSLISMAETCLPFIGNIVQCFEEGTDLIPGPVTELHSNFVTDSSVALSWEPPDLGTHTGYEVHYQISDPAGGPTPKSLNVTETSVEVMNLTKNKVYQFFVVAFNEHGSSVPSSILQINISSLSFNGSRIDGVVSQPHSLVVASHSASYVQIVWQPPIYSHPTDRIIYKVYHRGVKETNAQVNGTNVNSITLEGLKPNSQYVVYVTGVTEKGESPGSETLIAWTDPAHSPYVEQPRIQPSTLIEGKAMTIVCVALGDPTPNIQLYINGKFVKEQKNRHLTQIVENITRDMEIVSCYADNSFGTPMQASRKIQVSHPPEVHGAEKTYSSVGDSATIECTIDAHPEPKVAFWKNPKDKHSPIVSGGKFKIDIQENHLDQSNKYKYKLKISNVSTEDGGDYSCSAENAFGENTKSFQLIVRKPNDASGNITECCARNNVSSNCMDACSFFLDIESVIDRPQCIPDFNKLMNCAADGRDHRACCSNNNVPRRCLDWCRGENVDDGSDCAFSYTRSILRCFQDNRDRLPGPPQNVRFKVITENEVRIEWDVPLINPTAASMYRVFWRPLGDKMSQRVDSSTNFAKILNLKPGITYEAVIKAGNAHGTSTLTKQILFATEDNAISSASTARGSNAGLGIGVALLVLAIIGALVGAVWLIRKRQFGTKPPGAIAFENPSYIRETNPDSIHSNGEVSSGLGGSQGNGGPGNGWHSETLHPPRPETEVAPTLYEELRLGSEGAGFRRLKN